METLFVFVVSAEAAAGGGPTPARAMIPLPRGLVVVVARRCMGHADNGVVNLPACVLWVVARTQPLRVWALFSFKKFYKIF